MTTRPYWTTALLSLLASLLIALGAPSASRADEDDSWSERVILRGSSGELENDAPLDDGWIEILHMILMPDGRILMWGSERETRDGLSSDLTIRAVPFATVYTPHGLGEEIPAEFWMQKWSPPYDVPYRQEEVIDGQEWQLFDNLYCAGHTLLSNGNVLTMGGSAANFAVGGSWEDRTVLGISYATIFDHTTDEWRRVDADMVGWSPGWTAAHRWYPSATRLADGRVLVRDGMARPSPRSQVDAVKYDQNRSAEIFDPETETWELVSVHPLDDEAPPEIPRSPYPAWGTPYPHVFQLPEPLEWGGYDVLIFGNPGIPVFLSLTAEPDKRYFVQFDSQRPQTVPAAEGAWWLTAAWSSAMTSVMLPIRLDSSAAGYSNGSILVAGSDCQQFEDGGGFSESPLDDNVDVYDPLTNTWRPTMQMSVGRHHAASVILPDGKIVMFGGFDDCISEDVPESSHAQYVDPLDGFAMSLGADQALEEREGEMRPEVHGYHGVALLLPDGRVLYGSGRWKGDEGEIHKEHPFFRYYSPPYMSEPRIELLSAPGEISYGRELEVQWSGQRPLVEAVLMGLGSMTHSFDFNQRNVQLEVESIAEGTAKLRAPRDGRVAPPGHYMLFLLDDHRVPSIAKIVHLGASGQGADEKGCTASPGAPSSGWIWIWILWLAIALPSLLRRRCSMHRS